MENTELCSDCKKVEVDKNQHNMCGECTNYVNKYYCDSCKLKHGCNKGKWESIKDRESPRIELIICKFQKDLIEEIDNIIKIVVEENIRLLEINQRLIGENNKLKMKL